MATAAPNNILLANALVYIAGVECPAADVRVSFGKKQIPQCTISVPADIELVRLGEEDKVPVAVFYLDQWYTKSGKAADVTPTYRLLFDGDLTGWEYSKSTQGDSIVFTCTHAVMTLGQMFAKFLMGDAAESTNSALNSGGGQAGIAVGNANIFPLVLFKKGLFSGPGGRNLGRPFDFIENLLINLRIGGYPKIKDSDVAVLSDGTFSAAFVAHCKLADAQERISPKFYEKFVQARAGKSAPMEFFVRYNHKTQFDRRWICTTLEEFVDMSEANGVKFSRDPTFKQIVTHVTLKTMANTMENMFGVNDSFLNLMNTFYDYVLYDILMLPTAPIVSVGHRGTLESGIPTTTASTSGDLRLANYISKPMGYFSVPPECNILFPSMVNSISYGEAYATQVTRTIAGSPFLDYYNFRSGSLDQEVIRKYATANGWPLDIQTIMRKDSALNTDNVILYPEELFRGPVINNITMPAWYRFVTESAANFEVKLKAQQERNNISGAGGKPVETFVAKEESDPTSRGPPKNRATEAQLTNSKPLRKRSFDIYTRFTRMKYYEERFSQRRGVATMAFNPYIVPGFNFIYFDKGSAQMHIMGDVESVEHSINPRNGWTTTVRFGFARTLKENYEGAVQEAFDTAQLHEKDRSLPEFDRFYSMYPLYPTFTLANVLQEDVGAAAYYKRIFYQGAESRRCAFVFADYLKTSQHSKLPGAVLPSSVAIPNDFTKGYEIRLEVKDERLVLFENFDLAMIKVARPICSLEEYVTFINGGRGVVTSEQNMLEANIYGIPVPKIIREYKAAADVSDTRLEHHIRPTTAFKPEDVYDLRKDWVSRIERYRRKIYGKEIQGQ